MLLIMVVLPKFSTLNAMNSEMNKKVITSFKTITVNYQAPLDRSDRSVSTQENNINLSQWLLKLNQIRQWKFQLG